VLGTAVAAAFFPFEAPTDHGCQPPPAEIKDYFPIEGLKDSGKRERRMGPVLDRDLEASGQGEILF
jgi:hypothetical protein